LELFSPPCPRQLCINNASTRRGVATGSVSQAMAIHGADRLPFFFLITIASGNWDKLCELPAGRHPP